MMTKLESLYKVKLNPNELVEASQETHQSTKEMVGLEIELKNPHSYVGFVNLIRGARGLPHIRDPQSVDVKIEDATKNIEISSNPFSRKNLPYVLRKWSELKGSGKVESIHLSYSGKDWETLNEIALTAATFAPLWMSFWNPHKLDYWSLCWPHVRGTTILPREFGAVSIVSEHRDKLCSELRYFGDRFEAPDKVLTYALKNHNGIIDQDFKPPELDLPYADELKREITEKIKYPHYTKNVAVMAAWPFCVSQSSLFNRILPRTCGYCEENREDLIHMYTSLADALAQKRTYPHLDAAKEVSNLVAKQNIREPYEVLSL